MTKKNKSSGIKQLLPVGTRVTIAELRDRTVAVDAANIIYRAAFGTYLTDAQGIPTGHIKNILSMITKFECAGVKSVWVFESRVCPDLKRAELQRRDNVKANAITRLEDAKHELDEKTYQKKKFIAQGLSPEVTRDIKQILTWLRIPFVESPEGIDGEHYAAWLTKIGRADLVLSDDYDVFIFGAREILRHTRTSSNTNDPNAFMWYRLTDVLEHLGGISEKDLARIGVVLGTDYAGGVFRVGPKTVLKKFRDCELNAAQQAALDLITTADLEVDRLDRLDRLDHPSGLLIDSATLAEMSDWLRTRGFSAKYVETIRAVYIR